MAKPQRMAIGTFGCLLAAVIPVEWLPQSEWLPGAGIMTLVLVIIVIGCVVTIIRRLTRIAASLRNRPS